MIEITNLRVEKNVGGSRLIADLSSDVERIDKESTIWIQVEEQYEYMLADDVYDMFLFLPVYMSMYYHTDLYLHGFVSKELYKNIVDYIQPIMLAFSNELTPQKVIVDGFKECKSNPTVIGTGISCGVDCLSTIYDRFAKENDTECKLTHLFMLNCGWHGRIEDPKTLELFKMRCKQNKKAADEIGLPFVAVDSNLHAFLYDLGDKASYFNLYSIAFGLEKALRKYYISNSYSYDEVLRYGYSSRDADWAEFADPIAIPLMHSKSLSLVSDGCQYTRVQKTLNIADWDISKKYLNVCCRHSNDIGVDETNCSCCVKCNRTLLALDALDKLDNYKTVFDLEIYRKNARRLKKEVIDIHESVPFLNEIYELYNNQGKPLAKFSLGMGLRRIKKSLKALFNK